MGDYARQLLRVIYSLEELVSSILPPGGAQYSRAPLDSEKFEIFHREYFDWVVSSKLDGWLPRDEDRVLSSLRRNSPGCLPFVKRLRLSRLLRNDFSDHLMLFRCHANEVSYMPTSVRRILFQAGPPEIG